MSWQPPGFQPSGFQPEGYQPEGATTPVWSTVPNQGSALGTGVHSIDLDDYCTGATSYAVASPGSLPTGWSLSDSILEWDTDEAISQAITITASNDEGNADSNAFTITVATNLVAYVITVDGLRHSAGQLSLPYQSFEVQAGTQIEITIPVVDSTGDAADLTGCTARFCAGRGRNSALVIDSDDGVSTVEVQSPAEDGVLLVTLTDSESAGFVGTYRYEIWITDAAGSDVPVARGFVTFKGTLKPVTSE